MDETEEDYLPGGPSVAFVCMGARPDNPVLPDELTLVAFDDPSATEKVLVRTTENTGEKRDHQIMYEVPADDPDILSNVIYVGSGNPMQMYFFEVGEIRWEHEMRDEDAFTEMVKKRMPEWDVEVEKYVKLLAADYVNAVSANTPPGFPAEKFRISLGFSQKRFDVDRPVIDAVLRRHTLMKVLMTRLVTSTWIAHGMRSTPIPPGYILAHMMHGKFHVEYTESCCYHMQASNIMQQPEDLLVLSGGSMTLVIRPAELADFLKHQET